MKKRTTKRKLAVIGAIAATTLTAALTLPSISNKISNLFDNEEVKISTEQSVKKAPPENTSVDERKKIEKAYEMFVMADFNAQDSARFSIKDYLVFYEQISNFKYIDKDKVLNQLNNIIIVSYEQDLTRDFEEAIEVNDIDSIYVSLTRLDLIKDESVKQNLSEIVEKVMNIYMQPVVALAKENDEYRRLVSLANYLADIGVKSTINQHIHTLTAPINERSANQLAKYLDTRTEYIEAFKANQLEPDDQDSSKLKKVIDVLADITVEIAKILEIEKSTADLKEKFSIR